MTGIDKSALDSIPIAPGVDDFEDSRQQAGQDKSIAKRLEKNPESADAQLDNGLDESMDASDPPSSTQPGGSGDPAPSSGFDPQAEAKLQRG
jgi:hypothetical protein